MAPKEPQTILSLTGWGAAVGLDKPAPWSESVLILVNTQLEHSPSVGNLPVDSYDTTVAEISRLLSTARTLGVPVFHVHSAFPEGYKLYQPNTEQVKPIPELAPTGDEPVISIRRSSGFDNTNLKDLVLATERTNTIIVGFLTHIGVRDTVRDARSARVKVTVVGNATATRDLVDTTKNVTVPASVVQQTALAELADAYAVVVREAKEIV